MKRKTLENKLDTRWRTKNKDTATCEICATLPAHQRINYTQLHPHHIISRKNKLLKWDIRNRLWSCPYHHTFGPASEIVQDNQGGWFLNWESNNDWMGVHRPEDKEYLREKHKVPYKQWTLEELQVMLEDLSD